VPVDRIKDFQSKLVDYLGTRKPELLARIAAEGALGDELTGALKAVIMEFKQTYR
jgi:F-type H+/Na+-transporting ATPase subunit alpha